MTASSEEIQQHQKELEKKQKELDENNKKMNIVNNRSLKSVALAGYRNEEMVKHLHATYILYAM
jgi:hypothetical protein